MTTIQMIMVFIVLGVVVVLIFAIVDAYPSKHSQRIRFNNFRDLYAINPDRWELYHQYVKFVKPVEGYYRTWKETIMFQFNIIDFYRYQHWRRNLEKQKRKEKECKELQEVITILKSDLEKFEKKNAKNMDAAAKHTIELCGKIKGKNLTAQDIQEYLKQAGYNVAINPSETSPGPKTRREMEIKGMVDKLWDI